MSEEDVLEAELPRLGVTNFLAPNINKDIADAAHTGLGLPYTDFPAKRWLRRSGIMIHQPKEPTDAALRIPRPDIEGRRRYAFGTFTAGCGFPVVVGPDGYLSAGHGSRNAMLDRQRITTCTQTPAREHHSVVQVEIADAISQGFSPRQLQFYFLFCGPRFRLAHDLNQTDPELMKFNMDAPEAIRREFPDYKGEITRIEDGLLRFSLPDLAVAQAQKMGVQSIIVDCELTDEFADTYHPNEDMRALRNFAYVMPN